MHVPEVKIEKITKNFAHIQEEKGRKKSRRKIFYKIKRKKTFLTHPQIQTKKDENQRNKRKMKKHEETPGHETGPSGVEPLTLREGEYAYTLPGG